jgi:hypothetical protein
MALRQPFPLLIQVLREPSLTARLAAVDWDLLLRQADAANLIAALYCLLREQGLLEHAVPAAREQLEWVRTLAERHDQGVYWEVRQIQRALRQLYLPVVLLKGGAYATLDMPWARGRLFTDIDILVPEALLPQVESALMLAGWVTTHHDDYDQRYYRQWMHELPPMRHAVRETLIDVHHALLPKTAACHPDSAKLLAAARAVPDAPGLACLAPADMVLHSATHLFADGEFAKGLRDLYDLHSLLGLFGNEPGFWDVLPGRARELELQRYLYYALRYTGDLLGTAVPAHVLAAVAPDGPPAPLRWLMDGLFRRALLPDHASCNSALTGVARFSLYVRGNWLRMPPLRLARHLFHKAFVSPRKEAEETAKAAP